MSRLIFELHYPEGKLRLYSHSATLLGKLVALQDTIPNLVDRLLVHSWYLKMALTGFKIVAWCVGCRRSHKQQMPIAYCTEVA